MDTESPNGKCFAILHDSIIVIAQENDEKRGPRTSHRPHTLTSETQQLYHIRVCGYIEQLTGP